MKTIELTQGQVALVDDEDYDRFRGMKFFAHRNYRMWYVSRNKKAADGKQKTLFLHRLVVGAKPGEIVDHINGDGLDNRKENLRICSTRQNNQNKRHKMLGTTSKYKGVHFHKRDKIWHARVTINGKRVQLGYWAHEIDAAKAYDGAALKYFGEFASLNFPDVSKPQQKLTS